MDANTPEIYFAIPICLIVGAVLILGNKKIQSRARYILGDRQSKITGWNWQIGGFYVIPVGSGIFLIVMAALFLISLLG